MYWKIGQLYNKEIVTKVSYVHVVHLDIFKMCSKPAASSERCYFNTGSNDSDARFGDQAASHPEQQRGCHRQSAQAWLEVLVPGEHKKAAVVQNYTARYKNMKSTLF